ncbi:MAG TPA: DNA alkylation repair protein [Candidatus Babeliales bacterium]|nr:DNA alkylation repair protein [Candidatus Babeliales bacterium]
MTNKNDQIKSILTTSSTVAHDKQSYFFKTGIGSYAEHDQFIGVPVPALRAIAKKFLDLSRDELTKLFESAINEERLLALIILVQQYQKAQEANKNELYQFYMSNLKYVNNWNLVDASAHLIIGAHLLHKEKNILVALAQSNILWERRIAIISTWYFIRNSEFEWTFKIALLLLADTHDLIRKAVGWMLREAGKKNIQLLINFLDTYATRMPRTMLRYAIEKFPEHQRKLYLEVR